MTSSFSIEKQLPILFVADIQGLSYSNDHTYIHEPPMKKEKKNLIWASQISIPFSISDKIHAFLGPLPKSSMKPNKLKHLFPCLSYCKTRAFEDESFKLGSWKHAYICPLYMGRHF